MEPLTKEAELFPAILKRAEDWTSNTSIHELQPAQLKKTKIVKLTLHPAIYLQLLRLLAELTAKHRRDLGRLPNQGRTVRSPHMQLYLPLALARAKSTRQHQTTETPALPWRFAAAGASRHQHRSRQQIKAPTGPSIACPYCLHHRDTLLRWRECLPCRGDHACHPDICDIKGGRGSNRDRYMPTCLVLCCHRVHCLASSHGRMTSSMLLRSHLHRAHQALLTCRLPVAQTKGSRRVSTVAPGSLPGNNVSREFPDEPRVGVGVVVLRHLATKGPEVVLIKRGKPPDKGKWSFPGGSLELGEVCRDPHTAGALQSYSLLITE